MLARLAAIVIVVSMAALVSGFERPAGALDVCDVDRDGSVDQGDIDAIVDARGSKAAGPDDPRDVDRDGHITLTDAEICRGSCTLPDCRRIVKPAVIALRPSPLAVALDATAVLTVQVQNPSRGAGVRVRLASSDPTVASVPSEVEIPVAVFSATVVVTGQQVGGPVTITASLNSTSASAVVTVVGNPPAPAIAEPLVEGSTVVGGTGIVGAVVAIQIDGAPAGAGPVAGDGSFHIGVPRLSAGAVVRATQTVAGLTSPLSSPVTVHALPPAPRVAAPLVEGATAVRGTGAPGASVTVYADTVAAGVGTIDGDGTFTIVVSSLVAGQHVSATQRVDGIESIPSAPLLVVAIPPPPVISTPLVAGSVTVQGTGTTSGIVEVLIDGLGTGTAVVGSSGSWSLAVPPLTAGSAVKARQTVAGVSSALSLPVTVLNAPPPPALDLPLVATATRVGGSGVAGALVGLVVGGAAVGSATVAADGTWTITLDVPLTAGQIVQASETVAGVPSAFSAPAIVVASPPAPLVDSPIVAGSTTISGEGTSGASVAVSIDGVSAGAVLVGLGNTWTLSLTAALAAGQVVTARRTLGGVRSDPSLPVIVLAPPSPPVIDPDLSAGDTEVGGSGLGGASLELFLDGRAVASTSVNPDLVWRVPVAPLAAGTVVTATQTFAGLTSAPSAPVTVGPAVVRRIDLAPAPSATLPAGQSLGFVATGTFSDGTIAQPLSAVIWSSDNSVAVTIDDAGLATARVPGVANVRARSGAVTSASTRVVVVKADQTIRVIEHAPASAAFDDTFTVSAVASSGQPVAITTTGVCRGGGAGSATITLTSGAGTCVVSYDQAGDDVFNAAAPLSESTIARPLAQTITLMQVPPAAATYDTSFVVAATASSGLPVRIVASGACTGAGADGITVTMTSGTGACAVRFEQPGDTDYSPAPTLTESTVAQTAAQTITVTQPAPESAVFRASFSVAATASSGLAVSITTADACSGGGTATAVVTMSRGTGTCVVTFRQPGDVDYAAAPPISEQVAARRAATTTTLVTSRTPSPAGASITFTATITPGEAGGSVDFADGATSLGAVPVTAGTASLSTSALSPGKHRISASYGGDGDHGDSAAVVEEVVDTPPVSAADVYSVLQDRILVVNPPGVLANDAESDPGETPTVLVVRPPSNADVDGFTLGADGALRYVPQPGFTGLDTFTYQATDGVLPGDEVPVTIAVLPPSATPVALNDAYSMTAGQRLDTSAAGLLGVLANDDGAGLLAHLVSGPRHATTNGFTLGDDGSFVYLPAAGFVGVDSFVYEARAGASASNRAMVTITVLADGATPVVANAAYVADANGLPFSPTAAGLPGLLADPSTGTLPALVSGPLYGTLTGPTPIASDGSFTYTVGPGFTGADGFIYRAVTGPRGSNLASVTIRVTAVTIAAPAVTFGDASEVVVKVDGGTGTPGDVVDLSVDHGEPLAVTPDGSGVARFTLAGLGAGTHSLRARYTTRGYAGAASADGTLTVARAAPAIAWANPADITHGTPLGTAQLNATATFRGVPVPGTFTYTPPAGTILPIGSGQELTVVFTPDGKDFSPASKTVRITVTRAPIRTLTIAPSPAVLTVGRTVQFGATATLTDGASEDVTSRATWTIVTCAPRGAATIKKTTGLATAVAAGTCTVKAVIDTVAASASLEVRLAAVLQFSGRVVNGRAEVVRTGSLKGSVSVHYKPIDGTAVHDQDYVLEPGVLVFASGVSTAFIPVKIIDDDIAEGTETFTIALFDPSPLAELGRNASMVFSILDNDFGGTLNFARRTQTAPRGGTATLTIRRSGGGGTVLTVRWVAVGGSARPGTDFTPASGSVTFAEQDVTATFTIEVPPNARVGTQAVFGLRFPSGAAKTGPVGTSTLTITR